MRSSASSAIAVLLLPVLLLASGCAGGERSRSHIRQLHGFECELELPAGFPGVKRRKVFSELEEAFAAALPGAEGSQIRELNRQAGRESVTVTADVYRLLERGKLFSDLTDGAFDITALPLRRLWSGRSRGEPGRDREAVFSAAEKTDFSRLLLREEVRQAYLEKKGMAVDPVPLIRGWAADLALERIRELGARHGAVRVDTVYRCYGGGRRTCRFPRSEESPMPAGEVQLERGGCAAVVPSSGKKGLREGERRLFDTTTGELLESGVELAVVTGPDAVGADALAYILAVLGPEEGMELIEETPFFDALVVDADGNAYFTHETAGRVTLYSGEFGEPQPWPENED